MNKETGKQAWATPRLEKIEMVDTQGRIDACSSNQNNPQSKAMVNAETSPGCGAAS
jgi:hypothetical protein